MDSRNHRSRGLAATPAEPHPGWFLIWLPVLLIAFDGSPDAGSAMVRLGAVLLLGMIAWGMGRGPAGVWAERVFAALLLLAWFAVCATAFRLHGAPASMPARLTVTVGLLLGPALMLWAWRRRARLMPVVDEAGAVAQPGSAAALMRTIALVGLALLALDRFLGLQAADLLVVGTGLALYATFRVQGRHRAFGILG